MRSAIIALAVSVAPFSVAAQRQPTTQAASQPATQPTYLRAAADAAHVRVKEAESAALAKLHQTPAYLAANAKRNALENHLNQVRRSGTPEEKLAASHDFVSADQYLKWLDRDAIANDSAVKESIAAANKAVALADEELRQKKEEQARKSREEFLKQQNDPMNVGVREGRIIPGMTKDQAEGAYENRRTGNVPDTDWVGAIDMGSNQHRTGFAPQVVIHKTTDTFENGERIVYSKYMRYMNGAEHHLDSVTVDFDKTGHVTRVFGQ